MMKPRQRVPRVSSEHGQSMVEFAFVLPFLIFLMLGIIQFGLALHNFLAITDAARVGARAAAVHRTTGPCAAATTAIQNTVSAPQWSVISSRITCTPSTAGPVGSSYKISISYPVTLGLPGYFGIPSFNFSTNMNANATERLE
jgi:Flp pilus assembly protein TadG